MREPAHPDAAGAYLRSAGALNLEAMNLSGLSLRDLEYVVTIAEQGSFVKAAEQCRVAQPSLSVQVSKLEARLGAVIFERTTRKLIVTPEGRVLIAQMQKVLLEARNLLALANRSTMPFGGALRLSAIATLGPYYFPRVLQGLRAHYAELPLILGEGRTEDLTAALLRGDLDAVLMADPVTESNLKAVRLFREPFVLACPAGHPAAASAQIGWAGLDPQDRLVLEEGHCLRDQALAACAGIAPSNRHATSLETLKYMVAAGEGCTLVPALAVSPDPGVAYLSPPNAEYHRTIVLAWRASDPRRAEFEDLASQLRALSPKRVEPLGQVVPIAPPAA